MSMRWRKLKSRVAILAGGPGCRCCALLALLPVVIISRVVFEMDVRAGEGPPEAGVQPALPVVQRPAAEQPPVGLATDTHLDTTPPRQTKGLDLVKMGWTYNCMECHKLLKPRWHYDRPLNEHKDIQLDHGNNRFCLNCHHSTNRNAFVDYDGSEIAQTDVVLLCAKCHGPTYRDWQAGVHGRQNGHWNKGMGDSTKLRCIQCHDPHQPRFAAMKPLPPLRYPARAAGGSARAGVEVGGAHE